MTNANPVYYMWKFLILKTIMNLLSSLGVTRLNSTVPHSKFITLQRSCAWMSYRNCTIKFFRTRHKTNTDKNTTTVLTNYELFWYVFFSIHIFHEFDPWLVLIVLKLYSVWSKRLETHTSKMNLITIKSRSGFRKNHKTLNHILSL